MRKGEFARSKGQSQVEKRQKESKSFAGAVTRSQIEQDEQAEHENRKR